MQSQRASIALDIALGVGGVPRGRCIRFLALKRAAKQRSSSM